MDKVIVEIKKGEILLARYIPSVCLKEGLGFYSHDNEFIQVGSWNYNQGKLLLAHNHNLVPRTINRTQEVVVVIRGRIKASVYDEENNFIQDFTAETGDVFIMLSGGHGYEILEDNTLAIEIKNGPYPGAEIDRRRI